MKLQDLQRIDPNFDPNSYKTIPALRNQLFGDDKFINSESHATAEHEARELIRASISQSLGGKRVYAQDEITSVHPKSPKSQKMFNELASGEAVIR